MGGPLPLLTFRLEAVPEMGYDPMADPPRGEIIIKGPVVFQGYFKVCAHNCTHGGSCLCEGHSASSSHVLKDLPPHLLQALRQ